MEFKQGQYKIEFTVFNKTETGELSGLRSGVQHEGGKKFSDHKAKNVGVHDEVEKKVGELVDKVVEKSVSTDTSSDTSSDKDATVEVVKVVRGKKKSKFYIFYCYYILNSSTLLDFICL